MNTPNFGPSAQELDAKYSAIKDSNFRRRAFLTDVTEFYNSTNRALWDHTKQKLDKLGDTPSKCTYAITSSSPGCAIGRCIIDRAPIANRNAGVYGILDQLPKWMKEMDSMFLSEVQALHDDDDAWTEIGLSEIGKEQAKRIFNSYCQ